MLARWGGAAFGDRGASLFGANGCGGIVVEDPGVCVCANLALAV
jgi:hypothetical protein